jgi:hypothetical protein
MQQTEIGRQMPLTRPLREPLPLSAGGERVGVRGFWLRIVPGRQQCGS